MLTSLLSLSLLATLAPARFSTPTEEPFPASTALAEGVSPRSLAKLDELVQSLVDDEEVVGAELLVVVNGHSILHAAYGWSDLEARVPMETGSVFCVRSMTKTVVGAAVLMLVDDNLIELDDPIAEYLPAFDVEGLRAITVEQLLTHTGGLPFSKIMAADLGELDGIQAVAALLERSDLAFEPGSAFGYSDQGADTLTALVEVASGMAAADFVRTRLLEPLGMGDSTCVLERDNPLRARALADYAGSRGAWTRFWGPDDPPLFPFFLGSQGLYSTTVDYARFLRFWLRKGRVGKQKLLRARYVRKALSPGPYPLGSPTGFPGARSDYGYLMQLWTAAGEPDEEGRPGPREVVAFGHGGSDGTHAWAFPDEKALVLYFTQSRGNSSGLRVEEALGELFLGAPYDSNQDAPPFEPYLGYYWEGEGDLYRAIIRDGEDLALEVRGKAVVPLMYVGGDRWKLRPNPSQVLVFDRSPAGEVTGYHIGEHAEFRFEPASELPGADELAARVRATHGLDRLETLGPLRLESELVMEKLDIHGELTTLLAWPDRFRVDSSAKGQSEELAYDGEHLWHRPPDQPTAELEGRRRALLRTDNALAIFGDWRSWYPSLQVIQRLERGGETILVVRAGDTSATAPTFFVHEESARVVHVDSMTYVETLGRVGQGVNFGDFREVSGMLLPYRSEITLANPLIGKIVTTVTSVELGVELPAGVFELRE